MNPLEPVSRKATYASIFHEKEEGFLSSCGFELVNDPFEYDHHYLRSSAIYLCRNVGIYLRVSFTPAYEMSAGILFGRRWSRGKWEYYSNRYCAFASRLNLSTPCSYSMRKMDRDELMATMSNDLERTLPEVVRRVTVADVLALESAQYGAEDLAKLQFGERFREKVSVGSLELPDV